ncbi:GFA family protein [Novosphingobium soli]|uniref:GFA family protein n=1 Tax=Novosphingobium soli TaxID=574956 RepID=A0ABV6CQC0_9SPHN
MATEEIMHEGGCLCGAIRYKAVGDPVAVAICHCVNCQRNSGSAFSVNVIFPKQALTVEGAPAIYEDKGDTGEIVRRFFCGTCGTPLESRSVFSAPEHAVVKAGTFDHPECFVPDCETYCISAMPWWGKANDRTCYDRLNVDAIGEE